MDHSFIQTKYIETLERLKKGERPMNHFSKVELDFCLGHWEKLLETKAPQEDFFPLLCILDHAKTGELKFVGPIKKTFEKRSERELLIHTLSASHKIIIEECQRRGDRIPGDFILALKSPLSHSHPEVVEWTLRTIEALGHQSILLKEDVIRQRPGVSTFFNKHRKTCQQLTDYLMDRWQGKTF